MVKTSVENLGFGLGSRDAGLASALSLLPGLGQIYNGQARKGLLFLATTASYIFVFLLIMFNQGLIAGLNNFGLAFHMKPDTDLISVLSELHAGSTVSYIVVALFFGFVVYAIKDAYQYASYIQNKYIYADYALEMTEATSGSYLLHFVGIIILFLVAVFYLQHTHPLTQVTTIEFVPQQLTTKKIIHSKTASTKASEAAGLHKDKPVVAPSHHTTDVAKTTTPPPVKIQPALTKTAAAPLTPKFHPVLTKSTSEPLTPKQLVPPTMANRPPLPALTAPINPHIGPPAINPINNQTKAIMPQPTSPGKNKSGAAFKPNLNGSPALIASASGQLPNPVAPGTSGNNKYLPTPMDSGTSVPGKSHTGALPPGLQPIHGGGPSSHTPVVQPVLPPGLSSVRGTPGESILGNPPASSRLQGPANVESMPVDFTLYMNDLQRRIKRAWIAPKGAEDQTIVVLFKIHKMGELSNLRLKQSCGVAIADKAALKAIEDAAPFRQLPTGAPDDVDIQFTFDYKVFNGGHSGIFRNF